MEGVTGLETVITNKRARSTTSQNGFFDRNIVVRRATRVDRVHDPLDHRQDAHQDRERPQRREADRHRRNGVVGADRTHADAPVRIRDRDVDDAETDGSDDDRPQRHRTQYST